MEPTRESLLDAAESLFAELGVQASSLRAITRRAGANLAAVNYHFGSKQGLVRAVFSRRLAPLNAERLRMLESCTGDDSCTIEDVLRAFIAPLLRIARERPEHGSAFARLMGRAFSEPSDEVRRIVFDEFAEMVHRFVEALARLLPELPQSELLWRFHFAAGSMGHTAACGQLLEHYSGGLCQAADPEQADLLIQFLAAGLRAPRTALPSAAAASAA
jgi:AcrR family transcriptional regulator